MNRKAIQQMVVALAIGGIIIATGFTLVGAGAKKEQARKVEQHAASATAITPKTVPVKETLYYYDAVPLDKDLQNYIIRESEDNGIDPAIVMAMIDRESDYDSDNMGDGGKAYGLMQIHPRWHYERMQELGCTDLLDPYHNVAVGIDYLCELLNRYDGDMAKALVAYNQGHYKGTVTAYAKAVLDGAERLGDVNVCTR